MKTFLIVPSVCLVTSGWGQTSSSASAAVAEAWRHRPVIQAAATRIEEARAARRAAQAFPTTQLRLGRGTDRVPGATDDDLALIQPLDLFGQSRAAGRTAETQILLAEAELRQVKLAVQTEVLTAYHRTVASEQRLSVALALRNLAARLRDAAQRKFELGDGPEVQVLRATLEFKRAEQTVTLREGERKAAWQKLQGTLGTPATFDPTDMAFLRAPDLSQTELRRSRPDLLVLESHVRIAEALAREQSLAGRPSTSLEIRRSPWMDDAEAGLRFQVEFPIFDSGRNRNLVRAADLRRQAAESALKDASQVATAEWQTAQTEFETTSEHVKQLERLLEEARSLTDIAQRGFDRGAFTLIETLEANRALSDIEESLVEARLLQAQAAAHLLHVTGFLLEVQP